MVRHLNVLYNLFIDEVLMVTANLWVIKKKKKQKKKTANLWVTSFSSKAGIDVTLEVYASKGKG
jgi:hypothetical protein